MDGRGNRGRDEALTNMARHKGCWGKGQFDRMYELLNYLDSLNGKPATRYYIMIHLETNPPRANMIISELEKAKLVRAKVSDIPMGGQSRWGYRPQLHYFITEKGLNLLRVMRKANRTFQLVAGEV